VIVYFGYHKENLLPKKAALVTELRTINAEMLYEITKYVITNEGVPVSDGAKQNSGKTKQVTHKL